jgi:hypothetical protein
VKRFADARPRDGQKVRVCLYPKVGYFFNCEYTTHATMQKKPGWRIGVSDLRAEPDDLWEPREPVEDEHG